MSTPPNPSSKLIACLESYLCPSIPIGTFLPNDVSPALHIIRPPMLMKLKNLGPARVRDMRSLGHARQVVSHVAIAASPASCTKFNDALHAGIQLNGGKMAALAMLPCSTGEGKEAARELQRCVAKMKFVGGGIAFGKEGVKEVCGESYEDLWTVAEKFRVPIMVRTLWPTGIELPAYQVDSTVMALAPLATHLHTSQNHTPLPILHLYLSGVFDRHPRLRLVLANPGLIPSLLPRIEHILYSIPLEAQPKRSFLEVWQNNIFITTADVLDMSAMRTLLEQIPIDRVLYASNYPFEEKGKELMDTLKESNFLTPDEYERLGWKNAERLFDLKDKGGSKANGIKEV